MPPRGRDGLYSQAERRLRDAVITFENGNRIEIPEIRAMSVGPDGLDDMPIASAGAQEATFSIGGVDLNDMQDLIEEYAAERRREAAQLASAYGMSFMESLNSVWAAMSDDFELADEEEYVVTDPISFDELMGGCCGDN